MDKFEYCHPDAESVRKMATKMEEIIKNTPIPTPNRTEIEKVLNKEPDIEVTIRDGKIVDYKILNEDLKDRIEKEEA